METLRLITLIGICISAMLLTIGLIRPGFAVWWNQSNSRKNVVIVWGGLLMICAIAFFIISGNSGDGLKDPTLGVETNE